MTEGILANVQKPTLTCWSPAWDLVFSRILLTCLPACRANQQTPNEPTLKKDPLTTYFIFIHSLGVERQDFIRTDDAAKTTIMIINLLNLEDYAVN